MKVRTHPTSTNQAKAVTLELSAYEALVLADIVGRSKERVALDVYCGIADKMEQTLLPEGYSISRAIDELAPKLKPAWA